jgi:hypothetical protein
VKVDALRPASRCPGNRHTRYAKPPNRGFGPDLRQ